MKPLKLTISAFGPYLERTEIDFSKFGSSGIYLVTGDTGAGKSTIFEALCYALYGETVSGGDRDAKMLRNKSAGDDIETFVELEFMADGKRYRVTRSPKYELDKLKKTRKKAGTDAPVQELRHSEHTNRFNLESLDGSLPPLGEKEGNEALREIVGISKDNFKKISMIAQGEFMSVIRKKTDEREKILTSVFHTSNYGKLTEKLREYMNNAKADRDKLVSDITAAIGQIEADENSPFADELEQKKKIGCVTSGEIERIEELLIQIMQQDEETERKLNEEKEVNRKHTEQNEKLLARAETRRQHEKDLAASQQKRKSLEDRLPQLLEQQKALEDNPVKADEYKAAAEVIRSGLGDYDRLEQLNEESAKSEAAKKQAEQRLERLKMQKQENAVLIETTTRQLKALEGIEDQNTDMQRQQDAVREKGEKQRNLQKRYLELDNLSAQRRSAQADYQTADQEYQQARAVYDQMQKAFYDDLAGILARGLTIGSPCPVCGSLSHPQPAQAHEQAPTKEQIQAAKRKADKLSAGIQTAAQKAARAAEKEASARKEIADMIEGLFAAHIQPENAENFRAEFEGHMAATENQYREIAIKLKDIETKKKQKDSLTRQSEKLRDSAVQIDKDILEWTTKAASASTQLSGVQEQYTVLKAKLEFPSRRDAEGRIGQLRKKAEELEQAYNQAVKAVSDMQSSMKELTAAGELLMRQIAEIEETDMDALINTRQQLKEEDDRLTGRMNHLAVRQKCNLFAQRVLRKNGSQYAKAEDTFRRCEDLYNTASGKLLNRDKIRLDSYVVSAYFDRILTRANQRLSMMTDGRYCFNRSETVEDKRKTAGLDLNILDRENGRERSVNTLSGGESFMAALALSLGLSDEIQSESSGIRLETMFIDEGFGSLDDNALEKAVATLTELSRGDCLIGIISHVGRLKELINKRIVIRRSESNHTIARVEN